MANKTSLDVATLKILKQVLSMPPKLHAGMKLGRPAPKKKRRPKARASSAKPQNA